MMLALKRALTKVDPIPVLIFDEIDSQIGGRLGTVIGNKVKEIARDRQVLLITHLPQIACFGDTHIKVIKKAELKRTITTAFVLDADARVHELAEMIGGHSTDNTSVQHAKEMLARAI